MLYSARGNWEESIGALKIWIRGMLGNGYFFLKMEGKLPLESESSGSWNVVAQPTSHSLKETTYELSVL